MSVRGMALGVTLSALAVSGCNPTGGGSGGPIPIVAMRGGFAFIPPTVTVPTTVATTLTFSNPDAVIHDWTVDSVEVGGSVQKIQLLADPGKSDTKALTFTKDGTYDVYCSQPGHKEAGMVGKLTVIVRRAER